MPALFLSNATIFISILLSVPILSLFRKESNTYATLAEAEAAGAACFKYGSFIAGLIDFLIMAFIVFLFVRGISKLREIGKEETPEAPAEPAAPTTKICPFCKTEIHIEASRCPHCTSELTE